MCFSRSHVYLLLFTWCLLITDGDGLSITPITSTFDEYTLTEYVGIGLVQFSCEDIGKCIQVLHNGSVIRTANNLLVHEVYQPTLNDNGIYTCESYNKTDENICNTSSKVDSKDITIIIIDTERINVPQWQFVYLNTSYNLICESDAYDLTVNGWTKESDTSISSDGVIHNAMLNDSGIYTCTFTVLKNQNKKTTQLFVIAQPQIIATPINNLEIAVGPLINNYTIEYTAKSPSTPLVTWYHNGVELLNRTIHKSHDMGGASTIQVSRRAHAGSYRVVIQNSFDGFEVSEDIIAQSVKGEYVFQVKVHVPPSLPYMALSQTGPFHATVQFNHTNITTDDAPDVITLTLINAHNDIIDTYDISGHITQYTFYNLTPATYYSVNMSVMNIDGNKVGESVGFSTETEVPLVSAVHVIRTDLSKFNISLEFNYLGSTSLTMIQMGYRPAGLVTEQYTYIDITEHFSDISELYISTSYLSIDNSSVPNKRMEFVFQIMNRDDHVTTTEAFPEIIEPLSPPSYPVISSHTRDNIISLVIQLPSQGTPPILLVTIQFSSASHTFNEDISGYFLTNEQLDITVGDSGVQLVSGTRYSVRVRARNFAGWSNYSSSSEFSTYVINNSDSNTGGNINRVSETGNDLPVWAIILSGVVPCITVILIIIPTVLFVVLIKKFRKKNNGYPINEVTAADRNRLEHSPGESRRIAKFFSYDQPLTPRPPTSEPLDISLYPPSSSHDDSDSETNLTQAPKYKYVVSPTHNEIGIQGFLGSNPGSGTYVYV